MRILEVITHPQLSGAHTLVKALAQTWREKGHHVDVISLDPAPTSDVYAVALEHFGADLLFAGTALGKPRNFPWKQLTRLRGLKRVVANGHYDVIQAHCFLPNMYSRLATFGFGPFPPTVITIHTGASDYSSWKSRLAERSLGKGTGGVIAVSSRLVEEYCRLFPSVKERVKLIPNGIPWSLSPKASYRDKPRTFLATSRLNPQKDISTLIQGFSRFLELTRYDAELLIAGSTDDVEYGRQMYTLRDAVPHGDRIKFLGARTDVPDLLRDADVFVHSATMEAHPISIIEAGAAGLPIVTSAVPEIHDLLGNKAHYFDIGNSEKMAEALTAAVSNWPQGIAWARQVALETADRYSLDSCANAHMDVLQRAATRNVLY